MGIVWRPHTGPQEEFCRRGEYEVLYGGAAGGGKMLALDTPIVTPTGWTTMGEIKSGDTVFDEKGDVCSVVIAHPIELSPESYKIKFDDKSTITACADHLWLTFNAKELSDLTRLDEGWRAQRRLKRPSRVSGNKSAKFTESIIARNKAKKYNLTEKPTGSIRSTKEICETIVTSRGRRNHAIQVCEPLQLPEVDLHLDPYILGVWLGDGTTTAGSITTADDEIKNAVGDFFVRGFEHRKDDSCATYGFRGLRTALAKIGVFGKKHIPLTYLRSSYQQRLALLQGLMDTDGGIDKDDGRCELTTIKKPLADTFFDLVCGLGYKATLRVGRATLYGRDCGEKYRISFQPKEPVFRIERKLKWQKTQLRRTTRFRYITACDRVDPVPMRCITVDSPSGLYLAGKQMIPTHNTDCLLICATRNVDNPSSRGLILRRTFPQLQEVLDRCWRYYPHFNGQYRATEHRWYFPSGATVQIGHMQHEADKYNYQGKEFTFIGFDELTQFTESQYLYLHSRLRSTDPTIRPMIRSTTNPGGIGHYWVKGRFVDNVPPLATYIDQVTGLSRCFVPGRVYDNPTLVDNDPLYIKRLESLPEVERQRLLHGVWDVFEGQVFVELSQRIHGYDHFEPPPEWERIMAFDWGYSKPWAALYAAVDYDGVMYIYREVYGCKTGEEDVGVRQTNAEIIEAIHEAEKHDRVRPRMRIADPACWGPTKIGGSNMVLGPSFAEDASRGGLFFLKADNDRLRGIQQVHQRFKLETVTDDNGEVQREYPRCMISKTCENWWRTMMTLRQSPRDAEDIDTKQEDHLYDVFRYLCLARPIVPKRKETLPAGSFAAERRKFIRAREYARRHGCDLTTAYSRVR